MRRVHHPVHHEAHHTAHHETKHAAHHEAPHQAHHATQHEAHHTTQHHTVVQHHDKVEISSEGRRLAASHQQNAHQADTVTYSHTIGHYDAGIVTITASANVTKNVTSQSEQNTGNISNKGVSYGNGLVGVQSSKNDSGISLKIGGSTISVSGGGVGITIPTGKNTSDTISVKPNKSGLVTAGAAIAGGVVAIENLGKAVYDDLPQIEQVAMIL